MFRSHSERAQVRILLVSIILLRQTGGRHLFISSTRCVCGLYAWHTQFVPQIVVSQSWPLSGCETQFTKAHCGAQAVPVVKWHIPNGAPSAATCALWHPPSLRISLQCPASQHVASPPPSCCLSSSATRHAQLWGAFHSLAADASQQTAMPFEGGVKIRVRQSWPGTAAHQGALVGASGASGRPALMFHDGTGPPLHPAGWPS